MLNAEDDEGLELSTAEVVVELTTNPLFVAQGEASRFMLGEQFTAFQMLAEPPPAGESKLAWVREVIAQHGLVLFDTEASGRDHDSANLIEIAARKQLPDGTWAADFCTRVRLPEGHTLDPEVSEITHIYPADLADALDLDTALRQFVAYVGGAAVVAHNGASYDAPLLQRHLALMDNPALTTPLHHALDCVLDTLQLAYLVLPTAANRKLGQLYKAHTGTEPAEAHQALADVDTMQTVLFDYLLGELRRWPVARAALIARLLHGADWPMLALLELRLPHLFAAGSALRAEDAAAIDPLDLPTQVSLGRVEEDAPITRPQLDADDMAAYFSGDELVAAFGNETRPYQVRPAQQQMARAVAETINRGDALVVEAGTGTGKTRAYLYPVIRAAQRGNRAVISTHTHLLQTQLLGELRDAHQRLRHLSDEGWNYAILQGMSNYLCLRKLDRLLEDARVRGSTPLNPDQRDFFKLFSLAIYASWAAEVGASVGDEAGQQQGYFEELRIYGWEQFCRDQLGDNPALMQQSVAAISADCDRRQCPFYQRCFYMAAVERAQTRNIVVVNHALLLTEAIKKEPEQARLRFDMLVCDEAHTLEDAATDALTVQFDSGAAWGLIDEVRHPRDGGASYSGVLNNASHELGFSLQAGAGNKARQSWAAARTALATFGEGLRSFLKVYAQDDDQTAARYGYRYTLTPMSRGRREWLRVEGAAETLAYHLTALRLALEGLFPIGREALTYHQRVATVELSRLIQQLRELVDKLKFVLYAGSGEDYVYTTECDPLLEQRESAELEDNTTTRLPRWTLRGRPIEVGEAIRTRLLGYHAGVESLPRPVILTTATATIEGRFDYINTRLGLEPLLSAKLLREETILADFDYANRVMFMMPGHLHPPRRTMMREFEADVAATITNLLHIAGGHTLGLFTSSEQLTNVSQQLRRLLKGDYHLLAPGSYANTLSKAEAVEQFKENHSAAALLGVRSFWEGLDVAGLRVVTMNKLPFPSLGDPLLRARMERLERKKRDPFLEYYCPSTVILFKQGFGRLMRESDNKGVVVLLDTRLRAALYTEVFTNSLPRGLGGQGPRIDTHSGSEAYQEVAAWLDLPFDPAQVVKSDSEYAAKIDPLRLTPTEIASIRDMAASDSAIFRQMLAELEMWREQGLELVTLLDQHYPTLAPVVAKLQQAMRDLLHHKSFLPNQLPIMLSALSGYDTFAVLPTGAGKSACFQLPALLRPVAEGVTIVISPLLALMKDQVDKLREEQGVREAFFINTSQTGAERGEIIAEVSSGRARLLYIAPERLRDPLVRKQIIANPNLPIAQIVVDEAHCVSLWGDTFRPDFLEVANNVEAMTARSGYRPPVFALTATATLDHEDNHDCPPPHSGRSVAHDIICALQMRQPLQFVGSFDRPNLTLVVRQVAKGKEAKDAELLRLVSAAVRESQDGAIVVYCRATKTCERVAALLNAMLADSGTAARHYHAQMNPRERDNVQDLFMGDVGGLRIIVATKAFGMGVDKRDIRYVIHYDMPAAIEDYYQEVGRAGRDGLPATAVLLSQLTDAAAQKQLANYGLPDARFVISLHAKLQQLIASSDKKTQRERIYSGKLFVTVNDLAALLTNTVATPADYHERSKNVNKLTNALQWLVRVGLVQRETANLSRLASLRLRLPIEAIRDNLAAEVVELQGEIRDAQRVSRLLHAVCFVANLESDDTGTAAQLNLVAASNRLRQLDEAVTPAQLQDLLLELHLAEQIVFRTFEPAMSLAVSSINDTGRTLDALLHRDPPFAEQRRVAAERLRQMLDYVAHHRCRRRYLLQYFDPSSQTADGCARCDNCREDLDLPWQRDDAAELARARHNAYDVRATVLLAVAELADAKRSGSFSSNSITRMLHGDAPPMMNKRLKQSRHFGKLLHIAEAEIITTVNQLLAEQLLERVILDPKYSSPSLTITAAGRKLIEKGQ